jgi:glucose/arabinose dehydrogenase/mono/diheme cytochrome c family protein
VTTDGRLRYKSGFMRSIFKQLRWPALLVALSFAAGIVATHFGAYRVKRLWMRATSKAERTWERVFGEERAPAAEWSAPGYELLPHSDGFDFPVRIVPYPRPPTQPTDPFYFVAELPGKIKLVTLDGQVHPVAAGLLNFEWKPVDELGLMGLDVEPDGSKLYATFVYWDEEAGVYRNKVEALTLEGTPPVVKERTILLDMKDEATVASYCVQFVSLGPDEKLYVGIGAGGNKVDAQDPEKFAGKIIRMDRHGAAVESNPFFDPAAPSSARSYTYALGFRNPFDITWDTKNNVAVVSEVGPGIDRILRLERGVNYCFGDGEGESRMRANALYTWGPHGHFAPTGISLAPASLFGEGDGQFLYLGLFGPVYIPGPNDGKQLLRFRFDGTGHLASGPKVAARYQGKFFSSITDVVAMHDAVYFSDLYGPGDPPHWGKGIVYRAVRTGEPEQSATLDPNLAGAERGEQLFKTTGCQVCHDLGSSPSGKEGPPLGDLRDRLVERLASDAYENELAELTNREGAYFRQHRDAYQQLQESPPEQRPTIWFQHHVRDPRFDHPKAKMPGFPQLSDEDIDALADFLLGNS